MTRTPVRGLVALGLAVAAATSILTWGFYGDFVPIHWGVSITLWMVALLCLVAARKVRNAKEAGAIGLDRTQLDPMTVALFLVLAKASAWTGGIVAGAYSGIATYVVPHAFDLVAAAADLPGVVTSLLGGVALTGAALYLERHCETPPPTEGEPVG
ncbi:MAG TPA: DUF3180 domain-containing protein [Corynebacterium sp.]|nr:DUF3180 domain-containing protein [Corynebacterium sp.]